MPFSRDRSHIPEAVRDGTVDGLVRADERAEISLDLGQLGLDKEDLVFRVGLKHVRDSSQLDQEGFGGVCDMNPFRVSWQRVGGWDRSGIER